MEACLFVEPHIGATYDEMLALAQAAEQAGFDGFFRSDHYYSERHRPGDSPTDAWITLAALARETTNIRLGTMLTAATFRHPGVLAIQAAQVDVMSGGRVDLGLGAAWMQAEHDAYGIPFPATAGERLARLEEQLQVVTGLLRADGGAFSFSGEYYTLAEYDYRPRTAQPNVPIIVGGMGPRRTPALAATYADEYNVAFPDPTRFAERMSAADDACAERARDPRSLKRSVALTTICGSDRREAEARCAAAGLEPGQPQLYGTPDEVIEQVARYERAERVYFQLLDVTDGDQARLIAAEVVPQLR